MSTISGPTSFASLHPHPQEQPSNKSNNGIFDNDTRTLAEILEQASRLSGNSGPSDLSRYTAKTESDNQPFDNMISNASGARDPSTDVITRRERSFSFYEPSSNHFSSSNAGTKIPQSPDSVIEGADASRTSSSSVGGNEKPPFNFLYGNYLTNGQNQALQKGKFKGNNFSSLPTIWEERTKPKK